MNLPKAFATIATLAFSSSISLAIDYTLVPNTTTTNGPVLSVVGAVGGTTLFQAVNSDSTGTGQLDPFLRVQGNDGSELGYNSNNFTPDAKDPINYTHDLSFGSLQMNTINGVDYFQFYLDMQETGGNGAGITLTTFDIGIGTASQTVQGNTTAPTFTLLAWSLGTGTNTVIMTDVNQGNGHADVVINVPVLAFGNQLSSANVILYAGFTGNDSSFEEFGNLQGTVQRDSVPDGGATVVLLGAALAGVGAVRRYFAKS